VRHLAARLPLVAALLISAIWSPTAAAAPHVASTPEAMKSAAAPADYFQYPLPTWEPNCLGFGSQWRLCNGTVLRRCSATGAIWLHTGVDITTGIQPVRAAANGVIIGYIVDPTFRGGVLIRHQTADGIVITQYWHVWPRPGFRAGTVVTRGEIFADIADMGSRTHFHFAVFQGDYDGHAWNGALPPSRCDGFPAFPYRFVNATTFVQAHMQPAARTPAHHCRIDVSP
jgi:murein DD-endopeptidase MepM/ murein hydrolase activator NlpD